MRQRGRTFLLVVGIVLIWVSAGPAPATSTMVKRAGLDETIGLSVAIVSGQVVAQRSYRLPEGDLMTAVTIRVEESLKGPFAPGERLEIHAFGGSDAAGRQVVVGESSYRKGGHVLLQLEEIDGRLHTLGLSMGKWDLIRGGGGERHLVRDLSGLNLAGHVVMPEMLEGPVDFEDFRGAVERAERDRRAGGRE